MKSIAGLCAILLGLLGVSVASYVGVAIWPTFSRISERTDEFTANSIQLLDELDPVLIRLGKKASETAAAVQQLSVVADRVADGTPMNEQPQNQQILDLLQNMTPLMNQAESIAQSLKSIGMMMKSTADLGSRFGYSKPKSDELRSTAEMLLKSAEALDTVQTDLEKVREGKAVPNARKIAVLARQADLPLNRLALGLSDAHRESASLKAELAELRDRVRFWSTTGPIVIDLLLLWFGLGQLCLIRWGRQQLGV